MADENLELILAWKVLYSEAYKTPPDPNKPENIPYAKAKSKERAKAFERLMKGPGKPLFEEWRENVKRYNLALLFLPEDKLCGCPACMAIRKIRSTLELWLEAEKILAQEEKPNK
jgi:hypothetical protein